MNNIIGTSKNRNDGMMEEWKQSNPDTSEFHYSTWYCHRVIRGTLMLFVYFVFWGLCFDVSSSFAQTTSSLTELKPSKEYDNILSQKVAGDSLSTSFVIWIKQEVKAHKHAKHSENIYVLEGTGTMKIAAQTISVKAGDYLFVPCNTKHSLKVISSTPMKVLSIQTPEFLGDDRIIVE